MKFKLILAITFSLLYQLNLTGQLKTIQGIESSGYIKKEPVKQDILSIQKSSGQSINIKANSFVMPDPIVSAIAYDKQNRPIQFESDQLFRQANGNSVESANMFWQAVKTEFDMANPEELMISKNEWIDDLELVHVKMNQAYHNYPIYGAEMIFHGNHAGIIKANGDYINLKDCEKHWTESLDQEDLKHILENKFGEIRQNLLSSYLTGLIDINPWQFTRVWYSEDFTAENMLPAAHIVYQPNLAERFEVILDINSGEIFKSFESICKIHNHELHKHSDNCNHSAKKIESIESSLLVAGPATANAIDLLGQTRSINTYEVGGTYFLIDGSKPMFNLGASTLPDEPQGAIWTIDGNNTAPQSNNFEVSHVASNSNQWGSSPEGVSAHYNAEQAYLYFKQTFNRESINGGGGTIISIVNVADQDGGGLDNAFWNGAAIFYGNGRTAFKPLGRALDVAGHEMSHGVVQNTANLEYYGESGAMNESYADIFGAMIDREDWKIGEDVVETQFFPSGALRDMENPNNGAAPGDFGSGWQPDHTSDQFNGPEDNNGVHINSGIPNHAYYLYASDIGKAKVEQVFYRALTTYLTRSSQFVDLRNAVINAAQDIHGQNSAEVSAAQDAFNGVGIGSGSGTSGPTDVEVNPGENLILFSDENRENLYIFSSAGQAIFNPLSETSHISKPSITDDGSRIVFIDGDKMMRRITIDWNTLEATEEVIQSSPIWRNVIISKDGARVGAILDDLKNEISVFDFGLGAWNDYELFNPTFTEGIETGDVDFADAMEFDITGELIMYDAQNSISNMSGDEIQYWDISFLEVWNNEADTWRLGNISKLFSGLPEGVSIGNPTFSKNSPFIVAFDFIEETDLSILGANIETGDIGFIHSNTGLGYPSYSLTDEQIVYDVPYLQNGNITGYDIGFKSLQVDKINAVEGTAGTFSTFVRWPVWFGNGARDLTSTEDNDFEVSIDLYPNPTEDFITILSTELDLTNAGLQVFDSNGRLVDQKQINGNGDSLDLTNLSSGHYLLKISLEDRIVTKLISKL